MRTPFFFVCLISVLLMSRTATVAAVTCNPLELSPCAGAIFGSGAPSEQCCGKLREQQPCFCQYLRDPSLSGYIQSANAKKVAAACRVTYPNC